MSRHWVKMFAVPPDADKKHYALSPQWTVMCDFDGTITPFDVTDALLERFANARWEAVERDWEQGKITARQCMEEQATLMRASRNELDAFLDTVPIRAGFPECVALCERHSLRLIIISDGMDYAIRRILLRHGFGRLPLIANRLLFDGPSSYRLAFPYGAAGCPSGVCKCAVAKACSESFLLIGDGHSDCCVAGAAALTLAQHGRELERTCLQKNYDHLPYTDFFDVCSILESMLRQPGHPRHTTAGLSRTA